MSKPPPPASTKRNRPLPYCNQNCRTPRRWKFTQHHRTTRPPPQGSVLSPLLFIIVLEALSREFGCEVPWEDLYADNFVIIAGSLEECVRTFLTWKDAMEEKWLRNAGKTKIMICGSPAEFRRVPMCCLSHWSGQQQHLLQRL